MSRLILWFLAGCLLAGCGRLAPPVSESPLNMSTTSRPEASLSTPTAPPTSTLRPVTPISTPTPTITPTPLIYTIQPGDTLLKIAIQFDRSTELIQEANGIVDPRFLQIGQEIIIPPPEVNPEEPPTPTPTPPPLAVQGINFLETRQGTLWCLGEIHNPENRLLTEVVIEASLFDGAGILLAREATFTQLDVIPPHQSVPFAILFTSPPTDFAQYQVLPVAGVPLPEETRYYLDLEAFNLQGFPEGVDTYRLKGQLRNTGTLDAEAIRLVAVAYSEDNKLLAQRQAELDVSLLKAGAVTPFEIDLTITHGIVDHYQVLVQGLKAQQ